MKPRGIVIHTVGVPGDATAAGIRKYHMTPESQGGPRGGPWRDIGYHRVVRKNGTVEAGRALYSTGAHTAGANDTLGVCVAGDGDREAWTLAQRDAVVRLCVEWCRHFGWDAERVCGHREAPARLGADPTPKTCPGTLINMVQVRGLVKAALDVAGRAALS